MTVFLMAAAGLAAVYLFAVAAFYQAFKNWSPVRGSRPAEGDEAPVLRKGRPWRVQCRPLIVAPRSRAARYVDFALPV